MTLRWDHDAWLACGSGRKRWLSKTWATWAAWASGWASCAEDEPRMDSAWAERRCWLTRWNFTKKKSYGILPTYSNKWLSLAPLDPTPIYIYINTLTSSICFRQFIPYEHSTIQSINQPDALSNGGIAGESQASSSQSLGWRERSLFGLFCVNIDIYIINLQLYRPIRIKRLL
jgi:hypothetical protein